MLEICVPWLEVIGDVCKFRMLTGGMWVGVMWRKYVIMRVSE